MISIISRLSDSQKGILMMIGGFILLFHTIGIIQKGLSTIIIAGSLFLIIYGFFKAEYSKKLQNLLQSIKKNNSK